MEQYKLSTKIKRILFRPFYRRFDEVNIELERLKNEFEKLRNDVIRNYLIAENQNEESAEKSEIINFLRNNPAQMVPYDFAQNYREENITVYTDRSVKMKYVLHDNKKMYFPRDFSEKQIQGYYNWLLVEQDINSPHRYETPTFHVEDGETVADIGAAEGIFALSVIEKAKRVFLFECDEKWIEALNQTFAPWKNKIEIINKYISDKTEGDFVTLDDFIGGRGGVYFIKADIEGGELSLLRGAQKTLAAQTASKLVLCTYHKQEDAREFDKILTENGFSTEFSKGYLLCINADNFTAPYLRRGVIRAGKRLA